VISTPRQPSNIANAHASSGSPPNPCRGEYAPRQDARCCERSPACLTRFLGGAGPPSLPRKPMYGVAGPLVEVGRLFGRTPNGRQAEPSVDGQA
jgi:hypothetical protein